MSDSLRTRAEKIKIELMSQDAGAPPKPEAKGLCGKESSPEKWLEQALQLYLPPYLTAWRYEGCGALRTNPMVCSSTEALFNSLLRWTAQETMSSSRVANFKFEHRNPRAIVEIQYDCDGLFRDTRYFNCQVPKLSDTPVKEYPHQISCKQVVKGYGAN